MARMKKAVRKAMGFTLIELIVSPSWQPLVMDSRQNHFGVFCPAYVSPTNYTPYTVAEQGGLSFRHNNGINILFCDGHAAWFSQNDGAWGDDYQLHHWAPSL